MRDVNDCIRYIEMGYERCVHFIGTIFLYSPTRVLQPDPTRPAGGSDGIGSGRARVAHLRVGSGAVLVPKYIGFSSGYIIS